MSNYPLATNTWDNKELEAIQSVIDSDNYTMGDHVSKFEHDFGKFISRKYCLMVSSGSAANLISKWIQEYKWIAWAGLLAILIVAIELIYTDIKILFL